MSIDSKCLDSECIRRIVLIKGDQKYIFRYSPEHESNMLDEIIRKVVEKDYGIDWFDAFVIAHQMGRDSVKRLNRIRRNLAY